MFFDNEEQYQRILRETCQTQADITFKVKLDMLATRIRRQVLAGKPGQDPRQVIDQFQQNFEAKWKARTVCAGGFIMKDCSNFSAAPVPKGLRTSR